MVLIIGLLGLVFGSFINAAVWRIRQQALASSKSKVKSPRPKRGLRSIDYSLLSGRSVCPSCRHQLVAKDLIPVVSWLFLRGKCRYCSKPISVQYPVVELLTAWLFVWSYLAWTLNSNLDFARLAIWLLILVGLIILAVYDLRWMELPNRVMSAIAALAVVEMIIVVASAHSLTPIRSRVVAALLAGSFFYALHAIGRGKWMGGGDVKLAALMGLILGSIGTLVAMVIGFNSAAVISLALMAAKLRTRKDLIPFGPFLIAATVVAMLYGQRLFDAYLDFFLIQ